MSKTRTTVGIASLVVILGIGLAIYEESRALKAEESLSSISRERDALNQKLTDVQKESDGLRDKIAALTAKVAAAAASTKPVAPAVKKPSGMPGAPNLDITNPEMRSAYLEAIHAKDRLRFDRFFKIAHLSPDQQDRFIKLQSGIIEDAMDLALAQYNHGVGATPEARAEAYELTLQGRRQNAADMFSLLGDEAYQQYTQYKTSLNNHPVVDQLASQLIDTDSPITGAQASQLLQMFQLLDSGQQSAASPGSLVAGEAIAETTIRSYNLQAYGKDEDPLPIITDAAVTNAQRVLSPTQVEALKQLQASQLSQLKLIQASSQAASQ